jgi:hypothetical protein
VRTELESAQQRLGQSRQEGAAADREVNQLQQRLVEVRQTLSSELSRLDEARRSADSAEQHAKEVRARVQREAKRVAELAAAAVMAAAAGGPSTGEYRQVPMPHSGAHRTTDESPQANGKRDVDAPAEAEPAEPEAAQPAAVE